MPYPVAPRDDIVDILSGREVADPYRWLEDATSPATEEWSAAQDRLLGDSFATLADRAPLVERLRQLVPDVTSAPVVAGGHRYWTRRAAGVDHAVVRVAGVGVDDGDPDGGRVLVDPNALSDRGTVTLDGWSPSLEGDRLAYLLSDGGDEESRLWIVDAETGDVLDGPIDRLRYSSLAWLPGGRWLLYVRRLPPGDVPDGEEAFHRRVWLHRVGADPSTDTLLFGDGVDSTAYLGVGVSDDGAWVAVTVSLGTAPRNDLYVARLPRSSWSDEATPEGSGPPDGPDRAQPELPQWVAVSTGVDAHAWPHFDRAGQLWILTDLHAPRRRLCVCSPDDPVPARWREVVGEDPGAVLEDFGLAGDHLLVLRSRHAISELTVHDRATGILQRTVEMPGAGSGDLTTRRDEGSEVWVGYTDFATSYRVARMDPVTGDISPPEAAGRSTAVAVRSEQVTTVSADGTEVRVTVVSPADDSRGPRPAVLYGYGGFDVAMTPAWSSSVAAWVEAGGVWAVANLRGGSEEGEAWHRGGMRQHKQRVFEDFEAAADHLFTTGWTTPAQLGIMGGSNGGLLVGAALTRSPQRYRAVVCSAPLLDMVRYERFGLGATWNDEYGRADDPTELGWLLGYSPYHHVVDGLAYPAVLFTVFDGDSRVDPLHARKMAAALQHATSSRPEVAPVLLRREADVGHGARGVGRAVTLAADQLTFLGHHTGLALP